MKSKYLLSFFSLFFALLSPLFLYGQGGEKPIPEDFLKNPGKPVLVMFTASWCGPCGLMKTDILPHPEVKPLLEQVNFLMMDTDTKEGKKYLTALGCEKVGIPHFVLMDREQRFIADYRGYNKDPQKFVSFLNKALKP